MTFYSDLAATATALITDKGMSMVLTKIGNSDYDPTIGSTLTSTAYPTTGAKFGYLSSDIDGTVIQRGDQQALIAPTVGAAPEPGDTLTIGADVWRIVNVEILDPAGTVLTYKAQVRI